MVKKIQKSRTRRLVRYCVVADCGRKLNIMINPDGTYIGGHYFGKMNLGNGKKAEYWECNVHYEDSKSVEDS